MTNKIISHLFLFSCFFISCQTKKTPQIKTEDAVTVVTESVRKIPVNSEISLSGNIEGSKTVRLGFLVAGKIDFIAVNEGENVSKGQLISSLDPASYIIAREIADAQASQVQDEYNRLKIMHDSSSLSESDFSKITYGLRQALAQQKLHAKNLADTRIYSPVQGILLKKLAETGEITAAGLPLFVVSDIRKIKVSAFIPESELHKIRIGQEAEVRISSLSDIYKGKITEVGSAADAASRSFSVRIEIDNPKLLIRPGMIAEVTIKPEDQTTVLAVPAGSILHDYNNRSFVFMVDTVRHCAVRRDIDPGSMTGNYIEIASGLSEGEIIVTGGQQKLVEGSPVEIIK